MAFQSKTTLDMSNATDSLCLALAPGSGTRGDAGDFRFSVIVPVYEHWDRIPDLLNALKCQRWNGGFEVLLVDNGSSQSSKYPKLPGFARILWSGQPGSYAARNAGIAAARGEWLVFTDADCIPDVGWLAGFDRAVASGGTKAGIYAGRVQVCSTDSVCVNSYQIYDMVKGIPQRHYVHRGYGATANLCVAREIVERIGVFDPKRFSGGDAELCRRARLYGYPLSYVADASVAHPARDSWQALVTKTRRVKGGQLLFGPLPRRIQYLVRTFFPPIRAIGRFLSQGDYPWRYRILASVMQLRIWLVDMHEAVRLSLGASPERR